MTITEEPGLPELPHRLPTRELLLAQALEACITAERQQPGSAQATIAQQPAWARADLEWMMGLAASLDAAAADARISSEFRLAARARLMNHIGGEAAHEPMVLVGQRLSAVPPRAGRQLARHSSIWLWRGSATLVAAVLGVAATLTASASALPGEPLYHVKQAQEAFSVRLAADDQARALALLGQADARLDETARLLQQGRTETANETAQRYGRVVDRATTTYLVTIDDTPEQAPGTLNVETRLTQQQAQLQTILQMAPEPARANLREALVTTERGRALIADPRPVERALGRSTNDRSAVARAVPTLAAEDLSTMVPTNRSAVVPVPTTPQAVVARATEQPALVAHLETAGDREDGAARGEDSAQNTRGRPQDSVPNRGGPALQPARAVISTHDQHPDEAANAPAVVARADGDADQEPSVGGHGGTTSSGRQLQVQAAHEAVAPLTASDSRASSDSRSATGETNPRTKPPQITSAKVQPTPTTTPGRRSGGDSNATDSAHPTAVPGHTSPSDPRGGGGTDIGRGGD